MSKPHITASYGFVPLSDKVVFPEWGTASGTTEAPEGPPLLDAPLEDSVSGTLEVELQAQSQIFTRGTHDPQQFYQLPDGTQAIPGSTLRGMFRNLYEIITFSKMSRVNDHRYGVRDLTSGAREIYGNHMATIMQGPDGKRTPMPLVNAGWLRENTGDDRDEFPAILQPCNFAKVHYDTLLQIADAVQVSHFTPGERQSSVNKYRNWSTADGQAAPHLFKLQVRDERPNASHRPRKGEGTLVSAFGKVTGPGRTAGRLVFTGQPNQWKPNAKPTGRNSGNPKQHDFFFWGSVKDTSGSTVAIKVPKAVMEAFEFVHSDRGQQNRTTKGRSAHKPNEEWEFLRTYFMRAKADEPAPEHDGRFKLGAPVFFLADTDRQHNIQVRAMGLAMMFRLASTQSTWDAVKNAQPKVTDARLDAAQALFGHVPGSAAHGEDKAAALRGRVSFSHAKITQPSKATKRVQIVLSSPKASFYPSYVEQNERLHGGPVQNRSYVTYMHDGVRVRGWKRYRPLKQIYHPPVPTNAQGRPLDLGKIGTTFHPLPAGSTFRFKIRLHNVRMEELGGLLWALDFGGDTTCEHLIGMAKGCGYGRACLRITGATLRRNDASRSALPQSQFSEARDAFTEWMNTKLPGWSNTLQLKELRALARPVDLKEVRPLELTQRRNDFRDAKKGHMVLPLASSTP